MKRTVFAWRMRLLGQVAASGLSLVFAGCTKPIHVAWNDTQPIIEPVRMEPRVSPPQGTLTIYTDKPYPLNGDLPRLNRPPLAVYTVDGQVVAREKSPFSEGPLHFALTPGQYIVVSQSHGHWRQVQVDVQEDRETVVAKAQLDEVPLAAASQLEPTTPLVAGRSGLSR